MTTKTSFKDTVLFILGAFFASVIVLCYLFPDFWLFHTRRLFQNFDTEIPFDSTYIIISHFFHGFVQLWDRFDQVNNAYFATTNGIYGVANVMTAFVFIVLSPFLTHPGQALYHLHLLLFYSFTCLIRTIGGYLLLRKLVTSKAVIFVSIIFLNTMFTSYLMTPGVEWEAAFSFLPLLFYFILCFFEELRLRTFLSALLVMIFCMISSLYFTLGYFYQAVHFLILSCVVDFLIQRGWRKLRGRAVLPKKELYRNLGLAACCLLILLPYCFWGYAIPHDIYVHGSGLSGTQGRFNHILNFKGYFDIWGKGFANSFEYIGTVLDYHHNDCRVTWVFIGASSLFLALTGLVLSKDRRKYYFAAAIFFVILINNAWFPGSFTFLNAEINYAIQTDDHDTLFWTQGMHVNDWWTYGFLMLSTAAHALNVLTNPLCFLVRSFHMVSMLLPIMYLPLVAMGLESCLYLWQRKQESIYFNRRWILIVFLAAVLFWALLGGTEKLSVGWVDYTAAQTLKEYILCMATIFMYFILLPEFLSANLRWLGCIIVGCALAIDFMALTAYVKVGYAKDYNLLYNEIVPIVTNPPLFSRQGVVPDFQNPRLLPWREFFNAGTTDFKPSINGGGINMYGAFDQYTPMGRFFHKWTIYEPRPMSYKNLYPDLEIQQYLAENSRNVFFADYGFDSRYAALSEILRLNLAQRLVVVEADGYNTPFLNTSGRFNLSPADLKERVYVASFDWTQARIHKDPGGWEYTFDLPRNFPSYLSTTVFTNDYTSWRLMVGNRAIGPMQGKLTSPFTFDVQNIREKKLTILLPDQSAAQGDIDLQVKLPKNILDIWKYTYDDLGLTYEAPRAGWLVFNYPYDEKWELTIDGQKTHLSRVNRYFIGAPISQGEHRILLRYWPHTSLRFWIFISMVLSVLSFWGIVFYGIKREPL